ncbi:MAG TPA: hypothetical protein VFC21_03650 [Bryobacteraceae bacterium]|nr:hypothetical protein [Bryobacteraceae bacterium]
MKTILFLLAAIAAAAQPRIDNVLLRMVPPGTESLVGAHMDQIRGTDFYKKLVERQKLPQMEQFAKETGFDPRRDVRELLYAGTASGGALLARGKFPLHPDVRDAKPVRHGAYTIYTFDRSGYCILDATLAVAGDVKSIAAALDEWKTGTHTAARPLLALAHDIEPRSQFWGASSGFAGFLADNMPRAGGAIDFSKIFQGLNDTWFQANFAAGFQAIVHGTTATEQDAVNLRDTAKGLIGFGRLSVPENQPEMLKLWDGITVDQDKRSISHSRRYS